MIKPDLSNLFDKYPKVIGEMDKTFTSHVFIRELGWQNQREYVEALYAYKDSEHEGKPAPFKAVHTRLAIELSKHTDLIENIGYAKSEHIFNEMTECVQWKKK